MNEYITTEDQLKLRNLELNAVLEITRAVNNNLPEEALYKIYDFTLRANLHVKKLALYVFDQQWSCKVNHGTSHDFFAEPMNRCFESLSKVTRLEDVQCPQHFHEFDYLIPVFHKQEMLALVLVAGDGDKAGMGSEFIQALSNIIIVAIENKKLVRKQLKQQALRKELEIARDVQQFLFPDDLPDTARLKVEASYLPHDVVGGDYYDYIPINKNQFLICIADVSGKGISAAILMSNFQASLRTLIRQTPSLTEVIHGLNYQIKENAKGERFITCFLGIYDHALKTLLYVNAGHNAPLLIDHRNRLRLLEDGTTILGMFKPLPFLNEGSVTDLKYFTLFCYTDGITETENETSEEYGSQRLQACFRQNHYKALKEIHQDIIVSLDGFKGKNHYKDDITMVTCRVE